MPGLPKADAGVCEGVRGPSDSDVYPGFRHFLGGRWHRMVGGGVATCLSPTCARWCPVDRSAAHILWHSRLMPDPDQADGMAYRTQKNATVSTPRKASRVP